MAQLEINIICSETVVNFCNKDRCTEVSPLSHYEFSRPLNLHLIEDLPICLHDFSGFFRSRMNCGNNADCQFQAREEDFSWWWFVQRENI